MVCPPELALATLFPPRNICGYDSSCFLMLKRNTSVTKRFLFDASKIEALRAKYSETASGSIIRALKLPSRIEAVFAFIWSRFVAATNVESQRAAGKLYILFQSVNIRPKFDPPLPEHSFGNFVLHSKTIPATISTSYDYNLAKKIGEEIRKIDKDYVENFRVERDRFLENLKKGAEKYASEEVNIFVFSSLCRFPLYEADFGFGKPTWVASAARCLKNNVGFMDNKKGDGIEAYICLKPDDMAKFEVDKEFLAFVSPIGS